MMPRYALITGGSHRLGAVLTRLFVQHEWHVFLHYGRSERQAQQLAAQLQEQYPGMSVWPVQADLRDSASRKAMLDQVYAQTNQLDCLVNNAAQFEADAADQFEVDRAADQWAVNLMAPLDLTQLMARRNVQAACVIHVLDQKVFNLNPDYFSYTVSKLALERAVALQAQALAPKLRVCGVAPGLMYRSGPQTQQNFDKAAQLNLLRRPINPDDVGAACLFLAQNCAMTGVTLAVDNGQHLLASNRDVMFMVQEQ